MKIQELTPATIKKLTPTSWSKNDDVLDLSFQEISNKNLTLALEAINKIPAIKHLNLSRALPLNSSLASFLETNKTLISLDLSNNIETFKKPKEFKSLITALSKNKSLVNLNLSYNDISYSMITNLFTALKTNRTLKNLSIRDNEIGIDMTKIHITNFLNSIPNLEYLDLSHNGIQNQTAIAMGKYLEKNKYLQFLDLSNNMIDHEGIEALTNCVTEKNKTLCAFTILEQYAPSLPYKITSYKKAQESIDKHSENNKTLLTKASKTSKTSKSTSTKKGSKEPAIEVNFTAKFKKLFNYVFASKSERKN